MNFLVIVYCSEVGFYLFKKKKKKYGKCEFLFFIFLIIVLYVKFILKLFFFLLFLDKCFEFCEYDLCFGIRSNIVLLLM